MEGVWTTTRCENTEGFPHVLYETLQKLGVRERPEYEGREFESHGTERCEVAVYVPKSEMFPEISEAWSVSASGFRFSNTYRAVARKALRYLCQTFEGPIASTPMRFFPPVDKNCQVWKASMEALRAQGTSEGNPTVLHLASYLLALDELYDRQSERLRQCIRRAEESETFSRMLDLRLAEAYAQLYDAEHRVASLTEFLRETEDRHAQELSNTYQVARARRTLGRPTWRPQPLVLLGVPLFPRERRISLPVPPAPPPSEASEEEAPLPLSQEPRSRAFDLNEVD